MSSDCLRPEIRFAKCPIRMSLGILGRKWTMLVLRDIGIFRVDRFNRLLDSIEGLTPRVLSMRLRELEKEGYIKRAEKKKSPMMVRWTVTEKGRDALPILMVLTAFGAKWHADEVFEDKKPRTPDQLFQPKALSLVKQLQEYTA